MQAKEKQFKLLWESGQRKTVFKTGSKTAPVSVKDFDRIAEKLSFKQISNAAVMVENDEIRRKHRWKEMRNFWVVISKPPYNKRNLENALSSNHEHTITGHHFVMAVMAEFQFDNSLYFDSHLQYIYWSFDGGRADCVDWRDILATYQILKYFRLIKERTLELIMLLFDLFTMGEEDCQSVKKTEYVMKDAHVHMKRIFIMPCITDREVIDTELALVPLYEALENLPRRNVVNHRDMERLLRDKCANLVRRFGVQAWELLSTDMRLTYLDEAQQHHKDNMENLLYRHKLQQALTMNHRNINRRVFLEWKMMVMRDAGVKHFITRVLYRKRARFMRFWHYYTARKMVRRRKRWLAEAIGSYTIKARCFARIKLYNYSERRLKSIVGTFDKKGRRDKLAGTHLREFKRLNNLKIYYHRWWNTCVREINDAAAKRHNWERLVKKVMLPWFRYAHEKAVLKRAELITLENKVTFDRKMEEAERDANELMRLTKERQDRLDAQEAVVKEEERKKRLEDAKTRAKREKDQERNLVLSIQKDLRLKRVAAELKKMKRDFKRKWQHIQEESLQKAKTRTDAYIANDQNALAIMMKFEKLKKEFYMPPTPETVEREKMLSSPKNIVMLYLSAKLKADSLQLADIIPRFDKHDKGYLTYTEFTQMIQFVGASLNPAQISRALRDIDLDGDGYVEHKELEHCMKDCLGMGVPGCDWKMYIDPAEDVICYHNIVSNERVYEFQMTDKKMEEINLANLYGEAYDDEMALILKRKKDDWQVILKDYMARRLQYLYRQRKGRRWRKGKIWKIEKAALKIKTAGQKKCVRFLESVFMGYKSRAAFHKQLKLIIQKVWDVDSGQAFWYNHKTDESTWEMPLLLRRYGDVINPSPWMPVEQPPDPVTGAAVTHYWHVTGRRDFPRKPDGLLLCQVCATQISLWNCHECAMEYCWACHTKYHASPHGVLQKAKASKKQFSDPEFLAQMARTHHCATPSKPIKCDMCNSRQVFAGIHCNTCDKNMCKPCSRRIHTHATRISHDMHTV